MDWAQLISKAKHLGTLDAEQVSREISGMGGDETSAQLTAWIERHAMATSFMQTAIAEDPTTHDGVLSPGTRIGPWQLERLLGAGGMGEVYKARRADGLFEQDVALKRARNTKTSFVQRFEQERNRLAALDHPGIARIVDGGTTQQGDPYLTMEFVEGQPITEYAKANGLPLREKVRLVRELCAAVSHAHSRLILHCDIKPDNVLVNADGTVRLIDFGVASLVGGDSNERSAITLATAAPEQLKGEAVSTATDVFAIGMVIHLLVTGQLPKRNADGSVSVDDAAISDADLGAIIAMATAADPDDRYGSAELLRDDLADWARNFPVTARPLSAMQRFGKGVMRNKGASALAAALVLALTGGLVVSLVLGQRTEAARIEAEKNLADADHAGRSATIASEMMQRAFGSNSDQDRLALAIIEYAEAAHADFESDPERAAYVALEAGGHFMRRKDFKRAISILEPWLAAGYGSEAAIRAGNGVLARSLMDVGREADAAVILREQEAYERRENPFNATHAAAASQLAIATLEPADLKMAETVLRRAIEQDEAGDWHTYLYNQLAVIANRQGHFGEAAEYLKKTLQSQRANGIIEVSDSDTPLLNIANAIFYYQGRQAEAETILSEAESYMERKGESITNGGALFLRSAFARNEGDYSRAQEYAARALANIEKFAGRDSPKYWSAKLHIAELHALQGDGPTARAVLAEVPRTGLSPTLSARRRLAVIFVSQKTGSRSNQQPIAMPDKTMASICADASLLRSYKTMSEDGILKPHECMARLL